MLRSDQEALSGRFATKDIDKWSGVAWRPGYADSPVLDGAIATFECRVTARHEGGDHVIYVGEVVDFSHEPEGDPLVFSAAGTPRSPCLRADSASLPRLPHTFRQPCRRTHRPLPPGAAGWAGVSRSRAGGGIPDKGGELAGELDGRVVAPFGPTICTPMGRPVDAAGGRRWREGRRRT